MEADANMNDILRKIENAGTLDELADVFTRLSSNIQYYCDVRRINVQMFQAASHCLTRMRLVLSDLEREEVRSKGACRELADRYLEMECRIRRMSVDLMHAMRRGR